ncbi:MAG: flagellar type III secretion system protein FlhB [Buchnera aphidicola (Nurudea yanoniella)]
MSIDNNEEKTEDPTSYRLKKAKKEGEKRYSYELNTFLILMSSLVIFWFNKNYILIVFQEIMRSNLTFNSYIITEEYVFSRNLYSLIKLDIFYLLKIIFFPIFLVILFSAVFSNSNFRINFLKFHFEKLNPLKGIKKLFSSQIFVELFKTIVKLFLVSYVLYIYMFHFFFRSLNFINKNIYFALKQSFLTIFLCILTMLVVIIPIVFFDFFWVTYCFYKRLKMTRKEISDEFKKTEGNPHIKSRIRRTMRTVARRRMLANIKKSDVIVMNPTHYAIALQYDEKSMRAPKIIAKGSGMLAFKIKNIGNKYSIPIVFSVSLANVLYRYTDIGQYVPNVLYSSIAEVLAWVWKVKNWKKTGGDFPKQPNNFFVPLKLCNFTKKGKLND